MRIYLYKTKSVYFVIYFFFGGGGRGGVGGMVASICKEKVVLISGSFHNRVSVFISSPFIVKDVTANASDVCCLDQWTP